MGILNRMGQGLVVTIAIALVPVTLHSQGAVSSALAPAIERIDEMTAAELARDGVGGVTIGVVSGPDLIWTKSYGYSDMEEKELASRDTIYRVGSITKQFTALMLLQLAESGVVRLSDPVEKYLPEINRVGGRFPDAPPITLVQLATMTSGLAREPANLPTFLKGSVSEWEQVLIDALAETEYAYEPDTGYLYSNIGYGTLGATLGRAAGRGFVDYVRDSILDPLGMSSSGFEPNDVIRTHLSKGYAVRRDGEVDSETPAREHAGRGYKVPNGALYTDVEDLARFVSFLLGEGPERVLSGERLEDNFNRVNSSNGSLDAGYGIGFQLRRLGELVVYGHGGSVAGYQAGAYFDRQSKTGVIVLRNVGGGRFRVGDLAMRAIEEIAVAARGQSEAN